MGVDGVVEVLVVLGGAFVTGAAVCARVAASKRAGDVDAGVPQPFWHRPFRGRRCRAVREPAPSGMWGRCERPRGHEGDHALERGMDAPRWSTEWTG